MGLMSYCADLSSKAALGTKANMQRTVEQSSAIYFKRHKESKCRATLFRRLRASSINQARDVKQQTFGPRYLGAGQLSLTGFAS